MNTEKHYTDQLTETHEVCLGWVRPKSRVLELGCSTGVLSRALANAGCQVTGIEISPTSAAMAEQYCERVVCGDLESEEVWKTITGPFDAVICADILEHLKSPAAVVGRARRLLARDGRLIVAMPNIAHYSTRWALMRGRFEYTEFGILDSTHLRFYTRSTLEGLVQGEGFSIREVIGNVAPFRGDSLAKRMGMWGAKRVANGIVKAAFPDATVFKWCLMAEVNHGDAQPNPSEKREQA